MRGWHATLVGLGLGLGFGFGFITETVLTAFVPGQASAAAPSWLVQLKTSGGFGGRGNGSVSIDSAGRIKYEPPVLPGKPARACEPVLPSEELRAVGEAVAQSAPEGWKPPGLNAAAPDAFKYELELRAGAELPFQVLWYDNTRDRLPEDLKRLSAAIAHVMTVAATRCRG